MFQPTGAINSRPRGEWLRGEHPDLMALLHDGEFRSVRFRPQPRLVHLPVQALEALDPSDIFGFGNLHSIPVIELVSCFSGAPATLLFLRQFLLRGRGAVAE